MHEHQLSDLVHEHQLSDLVHEHQLSDIVPELNLYFQIKWLIRRIYCKVRTIDDSTELCSRTFFYF